MTSTDMDVAGEAPEVGDIDGDSYHYSVLSAYDRILGTLLHYINTYSEPCNKMCIMHSESGDMLNDVPVRDILIGTEGGHVLTARRGRNSPIMIACLQAIARWGFRQRLEIVDSGDFIDVMFTVLDHSEIYRPGVIGGSPSLPRQRPVYNQRRLAQSASVELPSRSLMDEFDIDEFGTNMNVIQ